MRNRRGFTLLKHWEGEAPAEPRLAGRLALPVQSSAGGFTLLELLLAVTVLGLIITSVYRTWSTSLNGWKRALEVSDSFQRERVVMDVLGELTHSAVYFPSARDLYQFQGTAAATSGSNTVSFVTASDALLPPGETVVAGLRRVTIALHREENGETFLGVESAPALQPENADPVPVRVISTAVTGFATRYRNPRDGTWVEEWAERTLMPDAIEYTVAFGGTEGTPGPITITRAMDLPVAQSTLADGQVAANTTNEVQRRDIDLSAAGSVGK
jgi:general secretion pathway protein J